MIAALLSLISPVPWPGMPAHPLTLGDVMVALHSQKER